jgi:hypothetical protein
MIENDYSNSFGSSSYSDSEELDEYSAPNELLTTIGRNSLDLLNEIPLNHPSWIPFLQKLTKEIDPQELAPFLSHGTPGNLRKCLNAVIELNEQEIQLPIFEMKKDRDKIEEFSEREEKAREFLVNNTKEDEKSHRLITKDSIPDIYDNYIKTTKDPICLNSFINVYRSLRILRDRHCKTDIYTCPYCDDYFPLVEQLLLILDSNSDDYLKCQLLKKKLENHQKKEKTQTHYFYSLWKNPPSDSVIVCEDAGKRFVLDGITSIIILIIY